MSEIAGPARVIDGDTIEIAGERIYHVPGGAYYDRTALVLHRGGSAGGGMAEVEVMIEVVIERWSRPDSTTEYRWSVWRDGHRIEMGGKAFSDGDDADIGARTSVIGGKADVPATWPESPFLAINGH